MLKILFLFMAVFIITAASPSRMPLSIVNQQEYHTTNHSPDDCYGDDHGLFWQARGILNSYQLWTYTSLLPICWDHHLIVRAEFKSYTTNAVVSIIDYGNHIIPTRITRQKSGAYFNGRTTDMRACNTDIGYWHAYSDPENRVMINDFEFAPRNYVTWQIQNDENAVEVVIDGYIAEPPSPTPTGGEGSWDFCIYPPPDN